MSWCTQVLHIPLSPQIILFLVSLAHFPLLHIAFKSQAWKTVAVSLLLSCLMFLETMNINKTLSELGQGVETEHRRVAEVKMIAGVLVNV